VIGDTVGNADEAGFLADHIADDLVGTFLITKR